MEAIVKQYPPLTKNRQFLCVVTPPWRGIHGEKEI
ncbi:hypothetical protein Pla110_13760 [Polystyrenella longa]|uniref:Uncharacterized protein n=1 Tax=Polystyrenella longa TaxID=2528007 RepID=A0A518CKA8_9PLAN|nr:hypothetical protein Pla110_13760 [Polystyrenella longa]